MKRKTDPKVSIILPTYNRAHLLKRSIKSVLQQTYTNFELIVVDDGSTDNTPNIVKSFKDGRIHFIRQKKREGANNARNKGIKSSTGNLIAFQDSDDKWMKQKLEKQVNAIIDSDISVGVVYVKSINYKNGVKTFIPKDKVKIKDGDIFKQLLKGNFISTPMILTRREYLEKVGLFDENLHRLQDWDLCIRLSQKYKFRYINEPLLLAYHSKDSISEDKKARLKAHILIFKKYKHYYKKDILLLIKKLLNIVSSMIDAYL